MNSGKLSEVRNKFLSFFESKGHLMIKSAPLVPQNDPTLLFVNAGMAPLKKYFLQEQTPPCPRITDSQRCLRVGGKHNDLADVGYTKRHHTFFEMLGNFSFGDYFQEGAITFAWEFLTNVLQLDKAKLYITVHPKDASAFGIWEKIVGAERITKLEANVWSMGEVGPFGYCSEIFYDLGVGEGDLENGDRYLEIWNLVFMQFYSDGVKSSDLPSPCVDTGMGLERIVSVLEGKNDTYDISFFTEALPFLGVHEQTSDTKIFLDHLRSIAFLIQEGVVPGPSSRDYILRRLMRRALKSYFTFKNLDFRTVVYNILNLWQASYDVQFDIEKIFNILNAERKQFEGIIENGLKMFDELTAGQAKPALTAEQLFLLHDTYGFSIDIAMDMLRMKGGSGDLSGFEQLMEENKEKTRKKSANVVLPYSPTEFVEDVPSLKTNIIGLHEDMVILDRTPFYAEGGGQVGDTGIITGNGFKLKITDTKKIGNVVVHKYEVLNGNPEQGEVLAEIAYDRRVQIRAHHSATHLLHQVLFDVLGGHVKQMGSYVCEDRLRLDFSHLATITQDQIMQIENKVNDWIRANYAVQIEHMQFAKAIEQGAKAFFNYDEEVRTIRMGDVSFELCGGSHVRATGDIGILKILKVSAISAGVKRIEAVCAKAALEKIQKSFMVLKEVGQFLNTEEDGIIEKLQNMTRKANKISVKSDIQKLGAWQVGYCIADELDIEKQMKDEKLDILCVCTKADTKLGLQLKIKNIPTLDAKAIMQELGEYLGARGCGGRADFAQTGVQIKEEINYDQVILQKLCEILRRFI